MIEFAATQWAPILVPLIGTLIVGILGAWALVWNSNRQRAMDRNLAMLNRRIDAAEEIGDGLRALRRAVKDAAESWNRVCYPFTVLTDEDDPVDIAADLSIEETVGDQRRKVLAADEQCDGVALSLAKLNLLLSATSAPARVGAEALGAYSADLSLLRGLLLEGAATEMQLIVQTNAWVWECRTTCSTR